MDEVFLDPEQAAKMLNLSAYTIRAYARKGLIPAHKIGRTWRFSRADLEDWVLSHGQQPSSQHVLVARDRATSIADVLDYRPASEATAPDSTDERQAAIATLRAIRARTRRGSVSSLVQESRRELLARGGADHDAK